VSFSGDKLLGGPQAGIILGSKEHIDRLKRNPLARVMRLDKMTLAALEATLKLYVMPERARKEIPTLAMLDSTADEMRLRAEELARRLRASLPAGCAQVEVLPETGRAGGGSLPMYDIPTYVAAVSFLKGDALDAERFLVQGVDVPIIARIKKGELLFDPRTLIRDEEMDEIARALSRYFWKRG